MKQSTLLILYCLFTWISTAQSLYFPPKTGTTWENVSPASLGWNVSEIEPLLQFLDEKNSKAFIVLKDGKIVIEKYFDTFQQDSLWYWASAGKSATSFLVGVAQQENLLKITDQTSKYLGKGWTVAPMDKEDKITIRNQLTMMSGLDDGLPPTPEVREPDNCLEPECLVYKADAGTRWAYHNAPYRLLQDVVATASGQSWQQFTNQYLKQKIGMSTGFWLNYIFYSKPRDMARFGLLVLNEGSWANDAVLRDTAYFRQMVNTSQNLNPSYGYLWWLNGKGSYLLPGLQFRFPTDLTPSAPDDMFAALGKNDQKIYVVPSLNIVVIRMGDSAGEGKEALSSFDTQLWEYLMRVMTTTTAVEEPVSAIATIFPNPGNNVISWESSSAVQQIQIYDVQGKLVKKWQNPSKLLIVKELENGLYYMRMLSKKGEQTVRWVKM